MHREVLSEAEISALLKNIGSASKVQGMLKRGDTSTRAQKIRQMGLVAETANMSLVIGLVAQSTKARMAQRYQARSGLVSVALQPDESPTEGALAVLMYAVCV